MSSPAGSPFPAGGTGCGLGAAAALSLLLVVILPFAPIILMMGMFFMGPTSREEIAWAPSPDGLTHAIVIETNGGATAPFGYLIELHPADHQGQTPVRAARLVSASAQCARGVDLHWRDARTLELRYVTASNVRPEQSVTVGGRTIRIVVQRVARDPAKVCD